MSHSDQSTPADLPELVITGMGSPTDGPGSLDASPPLPTNVLPGVVWLAPDVCLVRSHLDQAEDAPTVINVVGTSNCDDLPGWVLMLR